MPTLALVLGILGMAFAAPAPTGTAVGNRVPEFKAQAVDLSVAEPKPAALDSQATGRVTLYLVVGTTCPATNAYAERMRELEKTYGPKGVDFVYVYPNRVDTSDAKRSFHRDKHLGGRLIDDQGGTVARALGATKTSETILVGKDGVIVYRGGIDDNRDAGKVTARHLAAALDAHLAGKPVALTTAPVFA